MTLLSRVSMRVLSFRQPANSDDLVMRLQQGEPAAVGELYDAHHKALRAFAQRLTGNLQAAEDLVHEVFVQVPHAITRFRGDSSLRTFLIGIAANHARHFVRSAERRRAALGRLAEEPVAPTAQPDQAAERTRFMAALARALDTLPLEQRIAFVLCDVEEHSSGDAAAITGAPEATVRTRLFQARKKLRSQLEREGFR